MDDSADTYGTITFTGSSAPKLFPGRPAIWPVQNNVMHLSNATHILQNVSCVHADTPVPTVVVSYGPGTAAAVGSSGDADAPTSDDTAMIAATTATDPTAAG